MDKHTPGPWSCFVWDISKPKILTIGGRFRDGAKDHICQVDTSGHGEPGEMEANARLISAGPELLELAMYVKGCLDATGECVIKIGQPMDGIVTKLVNKAGGK